MGKQINDEDKQLNVWVPEYLKTYLDERSRREKKPRNAIIAELLEQDRAHLQGELIEQESPPLFREVLQTEMRKFLAQQRQVNEELARPRPKERKAE